MFCRSVTRLSVTKGFLSARSTLFYSSIAIPDRSFIQVSGPDTLKFLQGLCTNDTRKLVQFGDTIPTLFLSPKGRIIADSLLYFVPNEEQRVIIQCHTGGESFLSHLLKMYVLRSKVKISKRNDLLCSLLPDPMAPNPIGQEIVRISDPRSQALGTVSLSELNGETDPLTKDFSGIYNRYRIENGLSEGSEIYNGFPYEHNADMLNCLSFDKGCFVGQELTTRTKHMGVVRKRVVPLVHVDHNFDEQFEWGQRDYNDLLNRTGQCTSDLRIGDRIFGQAEDTNNLDSNVGEIISVDPVSKLVLGMMRLENLTSGQAQYFGLGKDLASPQKLIALKPKWWRELDSKNGQPLL